MPTSDYWSEMFTGRLSRRRVLRGAALGSAAIAGAALIGCSSKSDETAKSTATPETAAGAAATATATPAGAATSAATIPANLISLKTAPERGPGGTKFTITGQGLKPSTRLDFVWQTVDGSYKTELVNNELQYIDRQWTPRRASLGQVTTDAEGKFTGNFTAPEDFFGVHDIYALVDGTEAAKAGFAIERTFELTPREGPVGTPIKVRVTGLGSSAYTSTGAIRYDNTYMGFVSATTTHGTAEFLMRAAGPVGSHVIQFDGASHALPYLNIEQSPVASINKWAVPFRVTKDNGAPTNTLEWPDQTRVSAAPKQGRTTVGGSNIAAGSTARATLAPAAGPIKTASKLDVTGLPPGTAVDLHWMNVTGNRVVGGWSLVETPLGKATVSADGKISAPIAVPDTLGGWHAIRVVAGDKTLAEVPFFVERSIDSVTPQKVKAGEKFTVHVKGIGWTELDNGVAVTYDNTYVGMACGFNSNGDVTMLMVATGEPGTHLIELYPMIYDNAHGKYPWQYNLPHLTFAQDHPSLDLGYKLPVYRLAVEVV